MAKEKSVSPESVVDATTQVSYCPDLGIYHYRRADGSEFLFTSAQLEKSVDTYLRQGDEREATFMASLTSWARTHPHKIVTFNADGSFGGVKDPEPDPVLAYDQEKSG